MTPRKLKVGIGRLPYGGNGGVSSEVPDVGDWILRVYTETRRDSRYASRIEDIVQKPISDTPVTMVRNDLTHWAMENNVDVLMMVDSDQSPDMYLVDPDTKPFFQSSFDYIYENYDKGPVAIFAPYCGPPAHPIRGGIENVYAFRWESDHSGHMGEDYIRLGQYSRHEAALMRGIQEAGAGPTGLCMLDMRIFNGKGLKCGPILKDPYFEYEWDGDGPKCEHCGQPKPGPRRKKASTEDVTFFRELSMCGMTMLGYNPVLCNWDAWAGHWKPWCVGKPNQILASDVHAQLVRAVKANVRDGDHIIDFKGPPLPPPTNVPQFAATPCVPSVNTSVHSTNRVQELIDSVRGDTNGREQPHPQA